ncbi:GAF and ANTAR domain-containing protein [Antribacter gilvus]|uniref:GAF and ANTAR domain-containing protein n=1 Tax=Antribacter gilvus TaxID=2304675 RepID=UPI000F7921A7|nr:GAF and ANTAR domain-containing protein [Antribacter gilvus]
MIISSYLTECAVRAASVLGADVDASITMRQNGMTLRAGSSNDPAARCDQAEALADEGPCNDAMDLRKKQEVPDVADEERWQAWREQTLREGYASVLAVPAEVVPGLSIALNLYSRTHDRWDWPLQRAAEAYAELVASAVRLHLKFADLDDAAAGLYQSMSDRMAIEQAVGAIMEANGCAEEDARRILASASEHRNVAEREVAERILRALALGGRDDVTAAD